MNTYDRLIQEYIAEHPNAKLVNRAIAPVESTDINQYTTDSTLRHIKENCKLLISHEFALSAKSHLIEYVARMYPERLAEEIIWFDGLMKKS